MTIYGNKNKLIKPNQIQRSSHDSGTKKINQVCLANKLRMVDTYAVS